MQKGLDRDCFFFFRWTRRFTWKFFHDCRTKEGIRNLNPWKMGNFAWIIFILFRRLNRFDSISKRFNIEIAFERKFEPIIIIQLSCYGSFEPVQTQKPLKKELDNLKAFLKNLNCSLTCRITKPFYMTKKSLDLWFCHLHFPFACTVPSRCVPICQMML